MVSLAYIALGSNLGDRRGMLEGAIAELAGVARVAVDKVSSFHETEPVGGPPGQGLFLNAAAVLRDHPRPAWACSVSSRDRRSRFGRTRTVHWGERTLDLDLLLFDDQIIDTPELTIPHPRMAVRRFVLEPLAEIAPDGRRSRHQTNDRRPARRPRRDTWLRQIRPVHPLVAGRGALYHSFTHGRIGRFENQRFGFAMAKKDKSKAKAAAKADDSGIKIVAQEPPRAARLRADGASRGRYRADGNRGQEPAQG